MIDKQIRVRGLNKKAIDFKIEKNLQSCQCDSQAWHNLKRFTLGSVTDQRQKLIFAY